MPAKPSVIADPLTNRGTAFTAEERRRLGIVGRFPSAVETLDQQVARSYAQLRSFATDLTSTSSSTSSTTATRCSTTGS